MKRGQPGFTLVEIAIVLVIIGLLLGGILKGQELITSARVRNLADMTNGIQAAYFGFVDRYRRVPGDMTLIEAQEAIAADIAGGGNGNGRIDQAAWTENNAAWEHLAAAGFIQGDFSGSSASPTGDGRDAPLNPWNNPMTLGISPNYLAPTGVTPTPRLQLIVGRGIPVAVVRELDVKLDEGTPENGVLRTPTTGTPFANWGEADTTCVAAGTPGQIYNVVEDSQDCNAVYLF
jgi:prepilin-type N-terminal cleavage/methylation domain-containing protein